MVPGNDIDLAQAFAICRPCGEIIRIERRDAAMTAIVLADTSQLPDDVRPRDLKWTEVEEKADVVALLPLRSAAAAVPLLTFAVLWDGFLLVWYAIALTIPWNAWKIVALVFPLLHVSAGVQVTRLALAALLNRAVFRMSKEGFSFEVGPVKTAPERFEPLYAIDTFRPASDEPPREPGPRALLSRSEGEACWSVQIVTRDGRAEALGLPMPSAQHARFIAHRLNVLLERARGPRTYRT